MKLIALTVNTVLHNKNKLIIPSQLSVLITCEELQCKSITVTALKPKIV